MDGRKGMFMKSFIVGKRGKRLGALFLVLLQLIFQFPMDWQAEGKPSHKKTEISFAFTDYEGRPAQDVDVQVELSVYKKADPEKEGNLGDKEKKEKKEEKEETEDREEKEGEEKQSSSLLGLEKEKKTSASSLKEKEESPSIMESAEQGGHFTKEQADWRDGDGFQHSTEEKGEEHPNYGVLEALLFYTGQADQEGKIKQRIPVNYMTEDYTIILRVRGSNASHQTNGALEYSIEKAVLEDSLQGTVEIMLDKEQKRPWQGSLEFMQVEDLVFEDENPLFFSVYAEYSGDEDIPEIEYYIEDAGFHRERILNREEVKLDAPGRYTLIARVPEDEGHAALEARQEIQGLKAFHSHIFLSGDDYQTSFVSGEYLEPEINPEIKGEIRYAVKRIISGIRVLSIADQGRKMKMESTGKAVVEVTVGDWIGDDGIFYKGMTKDITITITSAMQKDFAFALEDIQPTQISEYKGKKLFSYKIAYGQKNPKGDLGEHSYRIKTTGSQSGKVRLALEGGEKLADFDAEEGILRFKEGQIGTVRISATAEKNREYAEETIYAEISVDYPDYRDKWNFFGSRNPKGWYKEAIEFVPKPGYLISFSDSWEDSQWQDKITLDENDESPEGKLLYIKETETGKIGKALKDGERLKKYDIDTKAPEHFTINYSKNKNSRIKSLGGYGFYQGALEIELKARDTGSKVSTFYYSLMEEVLEDGQQSFSEGEWISIAEGDPRFTRPDENTALVKFALPPEFRGKIQYYAVDHAENNEKREFSLSTSEVLVLDTLNPKGEFRFTGNGKRIKDHFYFQSPEELDILLTEKNFFPEDENFSMKLRSKIKGDSEEEQFKVFIDRQGYYMKKDFGIFDPGIEEIWHNHEAFRLHHERENGKDLSLLQLYFQKEGHYDISFDYKDPSGNPIEWENSLGLKKKNRLELTVDMTDPKIFFGNALEKGKKQYNAGDAHWIGTIVEENFSEENTKLYYRYFPDGRESSATVSSSNLPANGTKPGTVSGTESAKAIYPENLKWKKDKTEGDSSYKTELSFKEDGEYEVFLETMDLSGRKAQASGVLVVDKTPPKLRLRLSNDGLSNEKYFREVRKGSIEIEEANLDFSSLMVDFSIQDKAGNPVATRDYAAYLKNEANWKREGKKYSIPIEFEEDGIYRLSLKLKDKAGNENAGIETGETKAALNFVVDKKAPSGALKIGDWDHSKDGTLWTKLLDKISFGRYSNKKQVIRLQTEDNLSGIHRVEVLRSRERLSLQDLKGNPEFKNVTGELQGGYWSKEISPNESFITYVYLQDKAGNAYYLSSDGVILDQLNPEIQITLPKSEEKNGIYTKDVVLGISVTEPGPGNSFSGLKDVTYVVYRDGVETQSGSLFHFSKEEPQLNELKKNYEDHHAITILAKENNSNDIQVKVKAVDNAGNQVIKEERLSIDITKPKVTLSYDNNRVENEFYFKEQRTATITVEERNFSEEALKVLLSDPSGGKNPDVESSAFQKISGSGDSTLWEKKLYFRQDADYKLSISGEDLAGNSMEDLLFAEGTRAALDFTIDTTAPVLQLTYDNNNVNHEIYYKEGRRAEISVEEKNFRSDLLEYSLLKDGNKDSLPGLSFSGGGGRGSLDFLHKASIAFTEDGDYRFQIRVKDLAGNESESYAEEHFVIDQTAPSLTISDILNESANKAEVSPKISYGDRYLDPEAISVVLMGEVHGEHDLSLQDGGTISIERVDVPSLLMQNSKEEVSAEGEEGSGISYVSSMGEEEGNLAFDNFPEQPETDDVYHLSVKIADMAGNEMEEELWFSVNRFGSTYLLSERAKAIQGTYQKEGEEILVSEINADEVLSSDIVLYRNEEKHSLSEGAEYQTKRSGGNGKWYQADYLVKKDNFEKEGLYHLQISSMDKAGNVASTEQEEKKAELRFGIDRTPPRILLANVDDQGVYRGDSLELDLSVQDNFWLQEVDATIDGEESISWKDKSLQEAVAKDSFPIQISGEEGKRHKLLVVARDAAGNESRKEVSDFVISNNPILRMVSHQDFPRNTALGTMAGLLGLTCAVNGPSIFEELRRRGLRLGRK